MRKMQMNNKGFAISGMLYSILVLFLIMIMSILATLGARKLVLDKTKRDIYNDIVNEANKEQLAAYKIINKNSGTENFAADTKNTNVNANLPFSSKYYFKGASPNNYIQFAGACWRIISISQNNTIKIIYENNGTCNATTTSGRTSVTTAWNTSNNNNWYDSATTLRKKLETYGNSGNLESLTISSANMDKVEIATWYVGAEYYDSKYTLAQNIDQERTGKGNTNLPDLSDQNASEYTWENKIGLMNMSDFVKASSNAMCYNTYTVFASLNCKTNNYLFKAYNSWTLNANASDDNKVWMARAHAATVGDWNLGQAENSANNIRPVLYLKNSVSINRGNGTSSQPYEVS